MKNLRLVTFFSSSITLNSGRLVDLYNTNAPLNTPSIIDLLLTLLRPLPDRFVLFDEISEKLPRRVVPPSLRRPATRYQIIEINAKRFY